jgi:uncharacterized protein (TIGR02271 family)
MLERKTVVALFEDMKQADDAMAQLRNAGIPKDDIKFADRGSLRQLVERDQESGAGMLNLLKHLFGTDYRMEFEHASPLYAEWVRKGGVLVAVHTDESHSSEAANILEVSSNRETISHRGGLAAKVIESQPLTKDQQKVEIIEEELHVGKRKVQRGSVRVVKRVTETPVEETINLRDETVTIERRPLNRVANDADLSELRDYRVEMIETAEEPVVSKEAHVKEEITIKRHVVDHQEKIRDKVRKTEVEIEGLEPSRLRDIEFRKDFTSRFAKSGRNYSEYAPAYELGSNLASEERYRNRNWTEIENDARMQWESKTPNSWKDFADAIRHGWETIRRGRVA